MQIWLNGMIVDYGDYGGVLKGPLNGVPIISCFASPDRAFAQAADLLIKTGKTTGGTAENWANEVNRLNGLPLPIVSIYRSDAQYDPSLAGIPKRFPLSTAPTTSVQYWRPYRIPYQLDFWSMKTYTDTLFREWMESQFGIIGNLQNEAYISVTHVAPYGVKRQSLLNEGARDTSYLEGNQPRYRRLTYSLSLRAYLIPNPLPGTN
jgi:hypothetical protein